MMTYTERAREIWQRYGHERADGRLYVAGEYVGRVDRAAGVSRFKGQSRKLILPSVDPVDVVARWLI